LVIISLPDARRVRALTFLSLLLLLLLFNPRFRRDRKQNPAADGALP
jgi:hypothetical protein